MESSLKIVISERKKELGVILFYKYRSIRKCKNGLLKSLYTNKYCYAGILIDVNRFQINTTMSEHNHEADKMQQFER